MTLISALLPLLISMGIALATDGNCGVIYQPYCYNGTVVGSMTYCRTVGCLTDPKQYRCKGNTDTDNIIKNLIETTFTGDACRTIAARVTCESRHAQCNPNSTSEIPREICLPSCIDAMQAACYGPDGFEDAAAFCASIHIGEMPPDCTEFPSFGDDYCDANRGSSTTGCSSATVSPRLFGLTILFIAAIVVRVVY